MCKVWDRMFEISETPFVFSVVLHLPMAASSKQFSLEKHHLILPPKWCSPRVVTALSCSCVVCCCGIYKCDYSAWNNIRRCWGTESNSQMEPSNQEIDSTVRWGSSFLRLFETLTENSRGISLDFLVTVCCSQGVTLQVTLRCHLVVCLSVHGRTPPVLNWLPPCPLPPQYSWI